MRKLEIVCCNCGKPWEIDGVRHPDIGCEKLAQHSSPPRTPIQYETTYWGKPSLDEDGSDCGAGLNLKTDGGATLCMYSECNQLTIGLTSLDIERLRHTLQKFLLVIETARVGGNA